MSENVGEISVRSPRDFRESFVWEKLTMTTRLSPNVQINGPFETCYQVGDRRCYFRYYGQDWKNNVRLLCVKNNGRNCWDIREILVRNTGDFLKWKSEKNYQTVFWKGVIAKTISDGCAESDSVPKFRNLTELFRRNFREIFSFQPKNIVLFSTHVFRTGRSAYPTRSVHYPAFGVALRSRESREQLSKKIGK